MSRDANGILVLFLPHEAEVRRWLRRVTRGRYDESDIIQEAYYRIWRSATQTPIRAPRSYFFQVARNILLEQLRHDRVVSILAMAEIDAQGIPSEEPSVDRIVAGRSRLALVLQLIEELPARSRQIFKWRKIEERSQREIATRMGVSENVVEKEVARGLRYLLRKIGDLEVVESVARPDKPAARSGRRKRS